MLRIVNIIYLKAYFWIGFEMPYLNLQEYIIHFRSSVSIWYENAGELPIGNK